MHGVLGLGSGVWCRVVWRGVALRGEAMRQCSRLGGGPTAGRVSPSGEVRLLYNGSIQQ